MLACFLFLSNITHLNLLGALLSAFTRFILTVDNNLQLLSILYCMLISLWAEREKWKCVFAHIHHKHTPKNSFKKFHTYAFSLLHIMRKLTLYAYVDDFLIDWNFSSYFNIENLLPCLEKFESPLWYVNFLWAIFVIPFLVPMLPSTMLLLPSVQETLDTNNHLATWYLWVISYLMEREILFRWCMDFCGWVS